MKKRLVSVLVIMLSITVMGCSNSEKAAEYSSTTENNAQIVESDNNNITAINVDGTEPLIESTNEETESKEAADTRDKQTPEIEIADNSSENVTKEEGIYVYNEEFQISEIALSFSLKNISPTGATLVFDQYDAEAPKGELIYGENFVIEVLKDGKWEEAPITVEGDYAFYDIAYYLPCEEISEKEMDWHWLYGELAPGEYRIGKGVYDFIESGNSDKYMVYARFILNSN